MAEVRLSAAAKRDLVDIDEYGDEQFGPDVADIYSRGFNAVFALLRRHPLAGGEKPELGKTIRCTVHRSHRIFYHFENDEVVIIRIIHHSRDAKLALMKAKR